MNPQGRLAVALCNIALAIDRVEKKVDAIGRQEGRVLRQGDKIMATLADVQAKVTAEGTVVDSAVTLLKGLKDQLDAAIASNDPAAIQALSDSIGAQTDQLAAAVAANTPTAPPAP